MPDWDNKRTDETRQVETRLREHFERADAYRYNTASIRVRVIDSGFEGKPVAEREDMVMPVLMSLKKRTREDILLLLALAPSELEAWNRQSLLNHEFEAPSLSRL